MPTNATKPLSISALNRQVKFLLETNFGNIHVDGEISNLARPASGHIYFTLKDQQAQIRCAMFKSQVLRLQQLPKNGDKVLIKGKVSLYEGRGDYQLIASQLAFDGEGLLQQQFEQLKRELKAQGLFEAHHKKPLPNQISTLAVVSSDNGAAFEDICSVVQRRWPLLTIKLFASSVQGADAPKQLIRALKAADQDPDSQCILLSRGGGSLEDLFCFNDPELTWQIFHCQKPIISAVGHEIDVTISDYVADVRAATPTAGAELITPERQQVQRQILHWQRLLQQQVAFTKEQQQQRLINLSRNLRAPKQYLIQSQQRVEYLLRQLFLMQQQLIAKQRHQLHHLHHRLSILEPKHMISQQAQQLESLNQRLQHSIHSYVQKQQLALHTYMIKLDSLSPLNTLNRGYSISKQNQQVVTHIKDIDRQQQLITRLADGEIISEIKQLTPIDGSS